MSFILRILFTGLVTFVPSSDGKEVTVLLLNVPPSCHLSDGSPLAGHKPLLIARAGSCSGDCTTSDSAIAQHLFPDQSSTVAADSLSDAVGGGSAWQLAGSDISIVKSSSSAADLPALSITTGVRGTSGGQPLPIPTTATERTDFSWVADLDDICPTCTLNSDVVGATPPPIVAARLHLRSGNLFTWSVARIGSNVTPVHFNRLDGTGSSSSYSQSIASWVGVDIAVTGDSIELVDSKLDSSSTRSMTLSPDTDGKVEIAVLNLPSVVPPASSANDRPQVGKHFEMYYELMNTPPAIATRLVPRAGAASSSTTYSSVAWSTVHPSTNIGSTLLSSLRLDVGRGAYDRTLCPPTQSGP